MAMDSVWGGMCLESAKAPVSLQVLLQPGATGT